MEKTNGGLEFSDKPFEDKVTTLILSDGRLVSTDSHQEDINRILFDLFETHGRMERMLKFLCIRQRIMDFKEIDNISAMPLHGKALTRLKKLIGNTPDISDIIEKSGK